MKKLFVSQPMKDKTEEDIYITRYEAVKDAECILGEDLQLIDSYIVAAKDSDNPLYFLGKSIEFLSDADVAYFAHGWDEYRGCRIEHKCAEEYGITIIEEREDTLNDEG